MTSRPYLADQWRDLAHEAEEALRRREAALPRLQEKGNVAKAEQLVAEIRVWRAIAADWHWVVLHEPTTPVPGEAPVTGAEKLAALTDSLARCDTALRAAYDHLPTEVRFFMTEGCNLIEMDLIYGSTISEFLGHHFRRDRVRALLWHQDPLRNAALHLAVRSTIHIRAQLRREGQGRQAA